MSKIAVIGTGVMGSAIIESLIRGKVFAPTRIIAVDTDAKKLEALKRKFRVKTEKDVVKAVEQADVILLAVKPQIAANVCKDWETKKLVISILAGTTQKTLQQLTGSEKTIRVMPNTPAQIGAGVSGWIASKKVSKAEKVLVKKILESFGEQAEVQNEKMIDVITAISGSGPAYFFAFAEALEEAARKLGLGKNAAAFVGETFFGSAQLADASDISFKKLRENVTSKGGTTAAALAVFDKEKLGEMVEKAVKAAKKRSEELSKGK